MSTIICKERVMLAHDLLKNGLILDKMESYLEKSDFSTRLHGSFYQKDTGKWGYFDVGMPNYKRKDLLKDILAEVKSWEQDD